MRDDNAWMVGDEQVEWTGRADGIDGAQLSFSDITEKAQKAEANANDRLYPPHSPSTSSTSPIR